MLLNYAYVLFAKFFLLLNLHGEKSRENIFSELLEFAHSEIKSITLYELSAIICYLFSSDDEFTHSQNLMKVNKKLDIVKKVWNISWDITYLRYINDLPVRYLSGEQLELQCKNYVLITKDKALAKISDLLICDSDSELYDKVVPNIIIDSLKLKEKYRSFYEEEYFKFHSDEMRIPRIEELQNMKPFEHINELEKITNKLTQELLNI
ncbi:TPA: hypothetical protein N2E03_003747 [Clostridium botulinum]|nr:hypothetical protein [Clostridium botulinum]HCL4561042.1 hypothetical protein [Clostridium botulinum]HCL4568878.1 hypothetical protein [Clostridium botulinum]HCL4571809.1 hypothetical protein [Clostridium botulinum]